MTYYGAAASVAQSGYTYVEDENGPWEDPVTHKHYRRTDVGDEPEDMPTAAGQAYTQTDFLAVEPGNVVLSTTMYPIDLMTGGFGISPLGGYTGQSAAVNGVWVHPTLLRQPRSLVSQSHPWRATSGSTKRTSSSARFAPCWSVSKLTVIASPSCSAR